MSCSPSRSQTPAAVGQWLAVPARFNLQHSNQALHGLHVLSCRRRGDRSFGMLARRRMWTTWLKYLVWQNREVDEHWRFFVDVRCTVLVHRHLLAVSPRRVGRREAVTSSKVGRLSARLLCSVASRFTLPTRSSGRCARGEKENSCDGLRWRRALRALARRRELARGRARGAEGLRTGRVEEAVCGGVQPGPRARGRTWTWGVCRLLEGDTPTVAFSFLWRQGGMSPSQDPGLKPGRPSPSPSLASLLSPSLSLALSELPAVLGCLPRVKAAVLRVSLRPCRGRVRAVRMISMLPSPVCSVFPVSGRFPEEECPEPPTGLKATHPVSPPVCRSPGARHLRACPVREVVTVTWDPRPREPVEGVLRATSVLELAATWADFGAEGKTVVSLLSSGRARVGRRRRGGSRDACYSPSGSLGSVGGDRENRVLGMGRGSGSRIVTRRVRRVALACRSLAGLRLCAGATSAEDSRDPRSNPTDDTALRRTGDEVALQQTGEEEEGPTAASLLPSCEAVSSVDDNGIQQPLIKPSDNQLTLADMEIIRQGIGKGASGTVHLVRHKWTEQFFALKTIQFNNIPEEIRMRIALELKINYSLNYSSQCPYIVAYYQSFYDNGVMSIVLEYMDGGSLADFVNKVKSIPEPYLAAICKQVLKGLIYLHHEKHIVHRDLKPANLLVNHRGEVKITDFGVSAILESSSGQRDTFVGTRNYMSPERINGGKHGPLSDIWSLGLVLLECATGMFPYGPPDGDEAYGVFEIVEAIVLQPPPYAPSDMFSEEFCSFISSCVQKEPKDRKSALELLEHPFLTMYEDDNVDLESYFTKACPPLATF
ncbi:hypothetical protein Taro_025826 [Colocasia esculenta]|uniref:mitogen-activated protein kinase kinase n=1 Tax=Colocasia esculenta TaxID=4460 RepID=A0A843VIQ2_COLES|nr:hypothetical protein [Colocasia esculenta]